MGYWLKTPQPLAAVRGFVRGSVNYAAIRAHHFPQISMPLPPLSEQHRMVALLDQVARRGEEARRLRNC